MSLKALMILGDDTAKSNNAVDTLGWNRLMNLYRREGYLIIGDNKKLNRNDLKTALENVDKNTRIDLVAHGDVIVGINKSEHQVAIYGEVLDIEALFAQFFVLSLGKPLNFHLWSCHGKYAMNAITKLPENSTLTIHAHQEI